MLARFICDAPQRLAWNGTGPVPLPSLPRSGFIAARAAGLRKGTEGWLATLTARLPFMSQTPMPRPEAMRNYRAMLGHALADGRVVGEEAAQLATLATRAGLTQATARQVHEEFLAEARGKAEADGRVTAAEVKELQRAARELASSHLISDLEEAAAADRARRNGPLKGWRLLPVGGSSSTSELIDFAVGHGATVAVNVSKTVNLLITDGNSDDDPRIVKARTANIDIVSPEEARKILDNEIAVSDRGLFANAAGEAIAQQLVAEQAAEVQRSRPEWHQYWRPRELTPAEYREFFVDRHADWDEPQLLVRVPVGAVQASGKRSGCAAAVVILGAGAVAVAEAARQVLEHFA